jgi:hypothetical protein
MKKLAVVFLASVLVMAVMQTQAQEKAKEKAALKETKSEVRAERKALRKLEGSNVSVISKNNFSTDFGDIPNVKWKRAETFDEAVFMKDGKEMTAFYDFYGKLVGTCSVKTFADIPAKGQKEIKTKYKDYSIGPVIFFDDNEFNETDMMLWGTQFDDEDNYFVELTKGNSKIILRVNTSGIVSYFKQL